VHDQLPPFGEGSKILNSVRASNLAWLPPTVHVIVAKPYAWLQEPLQSAFLCSAVIFIKYRKVSTCTILPNFIDQTALYSRFGGHIRDLVKGEEEAVRLQFGSPGQPKRISRATKKVLARSHSRSLQLQARLDKRTELKILERSPKGGGGGG